MTNRAIRGEAGSNVAGVLGGIKIFGVAAITARGSTNEHAVRMASCAWQRGVSPHKGKAHLGVVELGVKPGVHRMAVVAGDGESKGPVIEKSGALVFGDVTRGTVRAEPLELADGSSGVATGALHGGVSAEQREAVVMLLHRLTRDVPALDGVTGLAVGAHLAAVNIRMTVRAFRSHVGEHKLDVTRTAVHLLMHAAQRKTRAVVIKFGNIADGLPTGVCMAIFARHLERAVRVAGGSAVSLLGLADRPDRKK